MSVKLLYFAWVREKAGRAEEIIELPRQVETVADLIGWMGTRGEQFRSAFERPDVIRVAIDQRHVKHDAKVAGAREIAFFPPVTGG